MVELEKIQGFIRKHHVMTLATVGADGGPWCAHVFYAWQADTKVANGETTEAGQTAAPGAFVFTTDPATRHGGEMTENSHVAAAIALETRIVGRVQGLQIEGVVRRPVGEELEKARRAYLRRFPYATFADLHLWLLEPTLMKITDNTLGFGKKLLWAKFP